MGRGKRRANGEGSIYRRKDGRWCAAVYVHQPDGTRRRKFTYGTTAEEARAKRDELVAKTRAHVPVPTRSPSVAEYLTYWLEHVARPNVRPTTYAKYEQMVRLYLRPTLGHHKLDRLSVAHVRRFVAGRLDAGDSHAKVQAMRVTLSAALSCACQEEVLTRNVVRPVRLPRSSARRVGAWSADEARAFLAAARGDPLYAAFVILLVYGLRRGEVLGLRWENVDFAQSKISPSHNLVRVGGKLHDGPVKSGDRIFPLLGIAVEALKAHAERQAGQRDAAGADWREMGYVFTTRTGHPVEPRNLARSFHRISATAGLRRIRLHDLRRTCALLLKQLGVPPRDAMAILGHSRIAITMELYTDADDNREAIQRLNDLLEHRSDG